MKMRLGWVFVTGAVGLFLLGIFVPSASAERAFSTRFSDNAPGDVTMIANTSMTCPASNMNCPAAQAGTASGAALSNNAYNMTYVDVDGDPTTFSSSTATLNLPSGSEVLFAGLYFGGRTTAGTGGTAAPSTATRGTAKLKVPGGSYVTRTADVLDDSSSIAGGYSAYANVTAAVSAAGSGAYTVADVQSGTGADRYGGWSIVIAYRDENQPPRNLTIYDGLQVVQQGDPPLAIPVSGFQTPVTGPVRTRVGFVTYEGDRGAVGDRASLNGTDLFDAANPANNFFNSSISVDGVSNTTGNPGFVNQLGYDSDLTIADGYLGNGDTSATIGLRTTLDQYAPAVINFATDLFAPDVTVDKIVTDLNGGSVEPGDRLRYTVDYSNEGADGASAFTAIDAIPTGTTYVPGSLAIPVGAPGSPSSTTDAAGDDLGEFDSQNGLVRFRLGQGATPANGGLIAANGGRSSIAFDVMVDSGTAPGTTISNIAASEFQSQTVGIDLSEDSPPVTVTVDAPAPPQGADLEVTKTLTSGPARVGLAAGFEISVTNNGPAPATAVVLTDQLSGGPDLLGAAPDNARCSNGLPLECRLGDIAVGETVKVRVRLRPRQAGTLTNRASVTSETADPDPANDRAVTRTPVAAGETPVKLVQETPSTTVRPGDRVTFEIVVKATGKAAAIGTDVCYRLPRGLALIKAPGARLKNGRICWRIKTLAKGQTRRFRVVARALNVPRARRVRVILTADGVNVDAGPVHLPLRLLPRPSRPGGFTG